MMVGVHGPTLVSALWLCPGTRGGMSRLASPAQVPTLSDRFLAAPLDAGGTAEGTSRWL